MDNSRLVPVARPDINGKIVTRHVRADRYSGNSASAVPGPSLSFKNTKKNLTLDIAHALEDDEVIALSLSDALNGDVEEDILVRLNEALPSMGPGAKKIISSWSNWFYEERTLSGNTMQDYRSVLFNGLLETHELISAAAEAGVGGKNEERLARSLVSAARDAGYLGVQIVYDPPQNQRDLYRYMVLRKIVGEMGIRSNKEIKADTDWYVRNERTIISHFKLIHDRSENHSIDRAWVDELTASPSSSLVDGIL